MNPQTPLTVAQVVSQVVAHVGEMTALLSLVTAMATEAVKNWGLPGKYAFLFSFAGGFALSCLVNGIVFSSYFGPMTILTGLFAGAIASGIYSGVKALNGSSNVQTTQDTTA